MRMADPPAIAGGTDLFQLERQTWKRSVQGSGSDLVHLTNQVESGLAWAKPLHAVLR